MILNSTVIDLVTTEIYGSLLNLRKNIFATIFDVHDGSIILDRYLQFIKFTWLLEEEFEVMEYVAISL